MSAQLSSSMRDALDGITACGAEGGYRKNWHGATVAALLRHGLIEEVKGDRLRHDFVRVVVEAEPEAPVVEEPTPAAGTIAPGFPSDAHLRAQAAAAAEARRIEELKRHNRELIEAQPYIWAWGSVLGSFDYYKRTQAAIAKADGAPRDAIYRKDWGGITTKIERERALAKVDEGTAFLVTDGQGNPVRVWYTARSIVTEHTRATVEALAALLVGA